MSYDEDEEFEDKEPIEIETMDLDEPANCSMCGKPECKYGCFRCGRPVCYNAKNYWDESTCGGWILDTWHPGHPEDNEFYCNLCLCAGLLDETVTIGESGMQVAYTPEKTLTLTIGDQVLKLDTKGTRTLVAYLYDQKQKLFVDEVSEEVPALESSLVRVSAMDDFEDLDGHPF